MNILKILAANSATSSLAGNLQFLQYLDNTAGQSSYTFSNASIGTASSDRWLIVCAFGSSASTHSITGVTASNVSMKLVSGLSNVQQPTGVYILNIKSGTTANIVVTFSITTTRCGIAMYSITGGGIISTYDSDATTSTTAAVSVNLDTPASGFVVGMSNQIASPASTFSSVTGFATTDVNTVTDTTSRVFSGSTNGTSLTTNTAYGLTYSVNGTQPNPLVVASFEQTGRNLEYISVGSNTTGATSYTFTGQNIGSATSDRVIVVGVMLNSASARTVSSVTLGGNAMTSIVGTSSASNCALFRIGVSAGTTADIVVTGSGASNGCFIVVYSLTGWGTVTTYASNSATGTGATVSTTIDTAAKGAVIGIHNRFNTGGVTTVGFETLVLSQTFDGTQRVYSGYTTPTSLATGVTYSVTGTAATSSIAVVAFS